MVLHTQRERSRSFRVLAPMMVALMAASGCTSSLHTVIGPRETLVPPTRTDFTAGSDSEPPDIQGLAPGTYAVIDGKAEAIPAIKMGESATIRRILAEGTQRNRVMDHLSALCNDIGPRLTGSSNAEAANRWALEQFEAWGLKGELIQWGECATRFDRGPSSGNVLLRTRARRGENADGDTNWRTAREITFSTLAWTRGTNGPVRGPVVWMPETEDDYQSVKSKLAGAWILTKPTPLGGRQGVRAGGLRTGDRMRARIEAREKVASGTDAATLPIEERVLFDGIAGFISASMDERDRVWTTAAPKWRERTLDQIPQDVEVIVRLSDYDYLNSRLTDDEDFLVEFDVKNILTPGPIPMYDTIAEITGTEKPDEYVYVMGHLDSWNGPGSQGTLDNGTGSAVTIEAARLLVAAGARPKRSIRFCLWTGEEQGLLGSRGYVQKRQSEDSGWASRVSAALNDDGGTNYQGGLRATADMVPMLAAATAPVNGWFIDSGNNRPMVVNVQTLETFSRMAASDHYSFVQAGIPGFFWDEVGRQDYGWSWHTQNDKFGYAIPEYLMQSATCAAITAYNLACAPELLPRLPERSPRSGEDGAPSIPPAGNAPAPASK